ncbi:MAG: energy transducer TonB [Gemmatimonadota bacterium]|nr:energy transducer TonB [Gemmatimonadota bacterium]
MTDDDSHIRSLNRYRALIDADHGPRAAASVVIAIGVVLLTAACSRGDGTKTAFDAGMARPDTYPIMLNKDMPFRYPPALYAEKVQGNVTLRLYVDKNGAVADDSTRVIESSTIPTLDSAAIKGSRELRFEPAKLRGIPMPVSILFPVYFRHPDAPPPAGDSILKKTGVAGGDSSSAAAATRSAEKAAADSAAASKRSSKHTSKSTKRRHRQR